MFWDIKLLRFKKFRRDALKVRDIYNFLNEITPFNLQETWDNSGLNIGNFEDEVKQIYTCLELDFNVLQKVTNDSLIITHHPVIFKPIKNFLTNIYPCNLINDCIKKNISLISIHTNFDKTHLNDFFTQKLLLENIGFRQIDTQGFSVIFQSNLESNLRVVDIAKYLKEVLKLKVIRYSQANDNYIDRLYITCGSNAAAYNIATSNSVVITGDIKYHDAKIANSQNISFIDIPHFESECIFTSLTQEILQKNHYKAIILHSQNPFSHI